MTNSEGNIIREWYFEENPKQRMWYEKIIQHKPWDIRNQWRVILCWGLVWDMGWLKDSLTGFQVLVSRSGEVRQACVRSDSLITPPVSLAWWPWWDICTLRCLGRSGWAGFSVFPARSRAGTPGWGNAHALYELSLLTVRRGSTTPQRTSPQTPHAGERKSINAGQIEHLFQYWWLKCYKKLFNDQIIIRQWLNGSQLIHDPYGPSPTVQHACDPQINCKNQPY